MHAGCAVPQPRGLGQYTRVQDRVPVAVFMSDGDFPGCKRESQEAADWYQAHDFRVVRAIMLYHMGHRRIPQTAAAFFAEQIGIQSIHPIEAAKTPPEALITEYYPPQELIANFSPAIRIASRLPQVHAPVVRSVQSE
jgi:hypothetical protein